MSFFDALKISASGLTAQRMRMDVISANLANANTTRTETGGPYRRKDVLFETRSLPSSFQDLVSTGMSDDTGHVQVAGIIDDARPFPTRYEPGHPDADPDGFVAMPNVDVVEEMVNLISASRSYEANISAISASKTMALKALEIAV